MITLQGGPANGVLLALKRAPLFLRVVQGRNSDWDALDLQEDEVRPGETAYAYQMSLAGITGMICSRAREKGCYPIATYTYVLGQPPQEVFRNRAAWQAWAIQAGATSIT